MQKFFISIAIGLATFFYPAAIRQHLLFDYTAENPDCLTVFGQKMLRNYNSIGRCCIYSAIRSNQQARTGNYSIRYELRKTDPDIYQSKRVEAARASNDEPSLRPRWYGLAFYLPDDYIKDPAPEIVTQWQSLKGSNPALALWTENGKWKLVIFGTRKIEIGDYRTGRWTDYVLYVKWSANASGRIELWKDGIKLQTIEGPNSYSGFPGNYMKNGIYKWPWKAGYFSTTTKRVVYIDDVRIGDENATYDDVKPGN